MAFSRLSAATSPSMVPRIAAPRARPATLLFRSHFPRAKPMCVHHSALRAPFQQFRPDLGPLRGHNELTWPPCVTKAFHCNSDRCTCTFVCRRAPNLLKWPTAPLVADQASVDASESPLCANLAFGASAGVEGPPSTAPTPRLHPPLRPCPTLSPLSNYYYITVRWSYAQGTVRRYASVRADASMGAPRPRAQSMGVGPLSSSRRPWCRPRRC